MPKASLNSQGRLLITDTEYRDQEACKLIPGGTYRNNVWSAPITWPAVKVVRALWPEIELDQGVIDWVWGEYNHRIGPALGIRKLALDPLAELTTMNKGLYPYQTTGAHFIYTAHGSILADDMGTGKTIQTIAALELSRAYPALIVCPSNAKINWQREFAKWAPSRTVTVISGTAVQRRKAIQSKSDVYVVGIEALRTHTRLAGYGSTTLTPTEREPKELNSIDWAAVIVDEGHRVVDPHAKQTRALWGVSGGSDTLRIALTGTPLVNTPGDLWGLLHFVSPLEWPGKTKFLDRYCLISHEWNYMKVIGLNPYTADEFHSLIEPRFLRRPKELVLPWLPPKVRIRKDVEMHPKQRKAYEELRDICVTQLDSGTAMAIDPLTTLTRLTQLASASADMDGGNFRLCLPSSKVDALLDLIDDMRGEPLVVFAQSRQLIMLAHEALDKKGISNVLVHGEQSDWDRQGAIDAFQDKRSQVILCTLGAGSESITLTAAATVCFLQRSWSLVQNKQAEDRIHRPGQSANQVTIIDLVATDTVEEHILQSIESKQDMSEEIVKDKETMRRILCG